MLTFNVSIKSPKYLPLIGVYLGVAFCVIDAINDVYIFQEEQSFIDNVLPPEPDAIWEQLLVIFLLLVFSIYAKIIINKQHEITTELNQYKNKLEDLVNQRNIKPNKINSTLKLEISERKK